MDASKLIPAALAAGLDGVVITEHHHIWDPAELDALCKDAGEPNFLLMAGFEYTSSQGDILIYGLPREHVKEFVPGRAPEEAIAKAKELGAASVAAHPTRDRMSFDERIFDMPLDALEVRSVNLKDHEQRLAAILAKNASRPPVICSDAHRLKDVGAYATEFLDPLTSMTDLKDALGTGRFRPAGALA
jgi:hypothetical protein